MRKTRRPFALQVTVSEPEAETKPPLDRKQIIAVALNLLDKIGLEGLTMRALAEELGVKAGSLYWHVKNKEELLDWLAEEVCAGVAEPDQSLSWRTRLEKLAYGYRQALLSHRDAAQLLAGTIPTGTNRLRLMDNLFGTLLAAGFSDEEAAYAGFMANDFVTEFVVEENRYLAVAHSASEEIQQIYNNFQNYFANLPSNIYPSITKLSGYLTTNMDMEKRFEFGLKVILDGLEKRL